MKRYQLVTPYQSGNVYDADNLKDGSTKCYSELKKSKHYVGCNEFAVMDIDNYKIYKFGINNKSMMHGGANETLPVQPPNESVPPIQEASQMILQPTIQEESPIGESKMDHSIKLILDKLDTIERKINGIDKKTDKPVEFAPRIYDQTLDRMKTIKTMKKKDTMHDEIDTCIIM